MVCNDSGLARRPTIVLVGSLDTKGYEYAYVRDLLLSRGAVVRTIDFGIMGDPPYTPDYSASDVAADAGYDVGALRSGYEGSETRARALQVMTDGVASIVSSLLASGECDALFGMGGSGGSSVIAAVMRSVPLGLPKLLVSTMASGDISHYVQARDLTIMYPVTDILGLNRISRRILENAAGAILGMTERGQVVSSNDALPLVAITMFGVTTAGARQVSSRLQRENFEVAAFHAVGSGGRAMEGLIHEGVIDGVVDFTTSELVDEYLGGRFTAGPYRLCGVLDAALPTVVVPGAMEVLNFGTVESVPPAFRSPERKLIKHNPEVCAVRVNSQEAAELGDRFAKKINHSSNCVEVVIPSRGFSSYCQEPDGPWVDRTADGAFLDAFSHAIRPDIPVHVLAYNINDEPFADFVADRFLDVWARTTGRESGSTP